MRILLLMVFGAAGALARYSLQGLVYYRAAPAFPTGTLVVNLLGCFLLGAVWRFGMNHLGVPPEWRIALTIGFLGSFTTFSTFAWETVRMLEDGEWTKAVVYLGASIVGGLFAVMLGIRFGNAF